MIPRFCVLILSLFLISCSTVNLKTDFDPGAPFETYTSYRINPDLESGLSELDQRRLVRLLDSTMQAKGFERKLFPDIIVDVRSQVYRRESQPTFGFGMGGTNGNMTGGIGVGVPSGGSSLRRQLDIAFFEFATDNIVWEALTEQGMKLKLEPEEREEQLRRVVIKALESYPPKRE